MSVTMGNPRMDSSHEFITITVGRRVNTEMYLEMKFHSPLETHIVKKVVFLVFD